MPLPELTPPPTVPSRTQSADVFNVNVATFLAWIATFVSEMTAFIAALPGVVNARIEAAVAAYDPEGAYSAVEVDTLLSAKADADELRRAVNDAYFLAMTS